MPERYAVVLPHGREPHFPEVWPRDQPVREHESSVPEPGLREMKAPAEQRCRQPGDALPADITTDPMVRPPKPLHVESARRSAPEEAEGYAGLEKWAGAGRKMED